MNENERGYQNQWTVEEPDDSAEKAIDSKQFFDNLGEEVRNIKMQSGYKPPDPVRIAMENKTEFVSFITDVIWEVKALLVQSGLFKGMELPETYILIPLKEYVQEQMEKDNSAVFQDLLQEVSNFVINIEKLLMENNEERQGMYYATARRDVYSLSIKIKEAQAAALAG